MKFLILGGNGQMGMAFHQELLGRGQESISVPREKLDVTDTSSLNNLIRDLQPNVVINASGYTKVELAETEKDIALQVNAIAVGGIAQICERLNIRLVHFSTDYVFDGAQGAPYNESDSAFPLSVYGKTKLFGEELAMQKSNNTALIIRTSWLYSKWGDNFAIQMLKNSKKESSSTINVVDDQVGQPTSARHIPLRVIELLDLNANGVFHLSNSGQSSWYEFARAIFENSGASPERVKPIKSSEYISKVSRPSYSVLSNTKAEKLGITPMLTWQEALDLEISDLREAIDVRFANEV